MYYYLITFIHLFERLGSKDKNIYIKYCDLQIDPSIKYDPNPVTVVKELSRL